MYERYNDLVKSPKESYERSRKDFYKALTDLSFDPSFRYPYLKSKNINDQYLHDPLILDLNGDGIKTTTLENGVYFDQ